MKKSKLFREVYNRSLKKKLPSLRNAIFLLFVVILESLVTDAFSQQRNVTGTITNEKGLPFAGVNIVVKGKGTKFGAITGADGTYSINVGTNTAVLVFSFAGYTSNEVAVGNQPVINLQLDPRNLQLGEVVVVGYGTTQKKEITGAITTVKTDILSKTAIYSVENMLQGRVPGLNVTLSSAQPGGALDVNIRGAISPRGNNSPLYVIDGVPITDNSSAEPNLASRETGWNSGIKRSPLSMINPSDILSVDVLKDASATAIYGSSAANGIIIITTKRGKEGRVQVNYRGVYTLQTPKSYADLLNSKGFMEQSNRMSYDRYLYENKVAPYGTTDISTVPNYNPFFSTSDIANNTIDNNWLDMVMRNGHINEHSLSLNGGNASTKVFASLNFTDQNTVLNVQNYARYTGRINLDQKIGKRVNFSVNLSLSKVKSTNASFGEQSGGVEKYSMLISSMRFPPTTPIYRADGTFAKTYNTQITNPLAFNLINDNLFTNRVIVIPKLQIDILKGLKLNITGGADLQSSTRKSYIPVSVENFQTPDGQAELHESSISNYTGETYLNYNKEFGKSRIALVAGAGIYKVVTEGWGLITKGFFTDVLGYNNIGIATALASSKLSSDYSDRYKISQFFRGNYTYRDRYTLSFVGRRDGSSIFSQNNKYGFFPGISAAWRISQEGFMSSIKSISDLKLRAGYGTSGNETVLSGNTLALYGNSGQYLLGNVIYNGVGSVQLANPNLTWETDKSINIGLDFALFANRISGSVDVFRKTAINLLDFTSLPYNNSVTQIADNVGSTRSAGFELALRAINVQSNNFRWETGLTFSHYNAQWVERNPKVKLPTWVDPQGGMRDVYGWQTDGIIQKVADIPASMPNAYLGNVKYVDQNKDGVLDTKDVVKLFNTDPKFSFGVDNTFNFKGFDLNIFLYGVINQNMEYGWYPDLRALSESAAPTNTFTSIKDVWSNDNPNGTLPGYASNLYSASKPAEDDFGWTKVNFVRIKTISLGYDLAKIPALKKIASNMRVFFTLDNVHVFTNYKGFDPEIHTVDLYGYGSAPFPQALSTSFGLDVTF